MQIFHGAPALSSFRLQRLAEALKRDIGHQVDVRAHFIHFVEYAGKASGKDLELLGRVLTYGPPAETEAVSEEGLLIVAPRAGTISPWSTKATDIAHNCGLGIVQRIERGVAYNMTHKGKGLSQEQLEAALPAFSEIRRSRK